MREQGWMEGIAYSYTYRGWLPPYAADDASAMFMVDGRNSWGSVDYEGSGTLKNIDDYIFETRIVTGYQFAGLSRGTSLLPYFGFGYRYLNDDMGGRVTSTGAHGYERESNYYYSPLGVFLDTGLAGDVSLRACLEYDHFWQGRQLSRLSDVSGYSDVRNKQQKGYGLRASLRVSKKARRCQVSAEPFVRYWNIRRSKESEVIYNGFVSGTGIEPKNNSVECGVRLAASF